MVDDVGGDAFDLPPVIDPAEREALLAQMVAFPRRPGETIARTPAQALKLARELASLPTSSPSTALRRSARGLVDGNSPGIGCAPSISSRSSARRGPRSWPSAARLMRSSAAHAPSAPKPSGGAGTRPARR
jgi:hypothetical protein